MANQRIIRRGFYASGHGSWGASWLSAMGFLCWARRLGVGNAFREGIAVTKPGQAAWLADVGYARLTNPSPALLGLE